MSDWPAGEHLASVYDAIYRVLGDGAARVSTDAFVVRLHECSRAFGELTLAQREPGRDVEPDAMVVAVLTNALAHDESGALALYALAMVIGPRLLVSVRDYLKEEPDGARRSVLSHAADVIVTEVRAVGSVVADREPIDDPSWSDAARSLVDLFDGAGMAESLGHRS